MNPIDFSRNSSLRGTDGVKYLWETFPNVPFFEVPFPVERDMGYRLPLLTETSDPKFLHPYMKIFKALYSAGNLKPGSRVLFLGLTQNGERARRVALNLSIVLAFEKMKINLVDLDLDAPAMHRLLGMKNLAGLLDHLFLGTPVGEIIRETNIPDLSLITPGTQIGFVKEMMDEIAWMNVIRELVPHPGLAIGVTTGESNFDVLKVGSCFDGVVLFFSDRDTISSETRKLVKKLKKDGSVYGVIWSQEILIDSVSRDQMENLVTVDNKFTSTREISGSQMAPAVPPVALVGVEPVGGNMTEKENKGTNESPKESRDEQVVIPEMGKKVKLPRGKQKKGFELLGPILVIFALFVIVLAVLLWWSGYFDGSRDVIVLQNGSTQAPAGEVQQPEGEQPQVELETLAGEDAGITGGSGDTAADEPPEAPVIVIPTYEHFFTINVASYTDQKWAGIGLNDLVSKGIDAYLVPVDITGKGTWIRLMIGSFRNKAQAQNEVDRLIASGFLAEGLVIRTPFAFLAGEWDNRGAAGSAMKPFIEKGVFPYIVAHEEKGVGRFRVYIGAFQGRDQATSYERILENNGITLKLVEREA